MRRCLSATFNNTHVGDVNLQRGLVLGMLTGESQATRQGRASESSGWNSTFVPEAIFSCLVGYHPAGASIKDWPGIYPQALFT